VTDSAWVSDATAETFEALVLAPSHRTPVLVDFWAAWCAPCRALGPVLEKLAEEYAGGFLMVKVDTDREQQLASAFKIASLPTVALFKDGKATATFLGAQPEGKIRAFLRQHGVEAGGEAPAWSEIPAERVAQIREALVQHPTRSPLQLELAVALLAVDGDEEAGTLLEGLPADLYGSPRAVRARAQISLRRRVQAYGPEDRVRLGALALLDGHVDEGLSHLLDALREDKSDDSPARLALVDGLQLIDDDEVVRSARRRMASVLFS
jgi:putative thioredoxin